MVCGTEIAAVAAAQRQVGKKKIGIRKGKIISEENLQGGSLWKAHIPHPKALYSWDWVVNSGCEDPGFLAGSGGGENVLTAFPPAPLHGHCPWWKQSREESQLNTLGLSALNKKK